MAYKLLKVALFSFWTAACNKIIWRDEPAAGSIDEVIPTTFFDHLPGSLKNKSSSATTGRIFEGKVFREAPKRERFQLCTGCASGCRGVEEWLQVYSLGSSHNHSRPCPCSSQLDETSRLVLGCSGR